MQFYFFVKFLKAEQEFFIKIDTTIMSITPTKQTIHNFNFDEKFLILFNKFNEKMTKLHNILKFGPN